MTRQFSILADVRFLHIDRIRVQARTGGNRAASCLLQLLRLSVERINWLIIGLLRLFRLREIFLFHALLFGNVGLLLLYGKRYSSYVLRNFSRVLVSFLDFPIDGDWLAFLTAVRLFAFILGQKFVRRQKAAEGHLLPSRHLGGTFQPGIELTVFL